MSSNQQPKINKTDLEKIGSSIADRRSLKIGWLYPKQMSTYGDRGNVLTLWQRAKWRGIDVDVKEIDIGEKINPVHFDLFFFGGGQDQAQNQIAKDLQEKKESLRKAVRLGSVFLGICGGYQLFGHYYRPYVGDDLPGLGILDVTTIASSQRMIGNIVVESNADLGFMSDKFLVGFENHSGKTFVGKRAKSLGRVTVGSGNNGEDRTEGAYEGNVFGCYLHGPVLPKNPAFADLLLERALKRRYKNFKLTQIDDDLENQTHLSAINRSREAT